MKRKSLLFALLVALFMPWAANAQESIPYTEGFENMSSASDITAAGWISYQTHNGSFLAIETSESNVHSGSKALNIDSWDAGSSSDYVVVGLPLVNAAINTLQITFSYKVSTGTVYVGYLTDANDASTFVSLQSFSSSSSYTTKTVELNAAPATAARIAIKYLNWYRCYVDDIEVKALPNCLKPTSVTATPDGNITWEGEGSTWNLNYKASSASTWTEVNGLTSMSYTIPNLTGLTTYSVRVQNVCDDNTTTDWTTATFTTPASIPLVEPFNSSSAPTGWTRYNGLLSGVMDGTVTLQTTTSGWNFGTGNNVFNNHAKANIYSTIAKYWLVTPALLMENNVQLTFDLALTTYSGSNQAVDQTQQADDKFVVLITTDGGTTWTILRQWDNAGSEYVYNSISPASTGQVVTIDLSSYAGQNIAVAFYGESTVSGGDNNLHIDNVSIDYIPSCFKPTELNATNITTNAAELSWTANSGETAWKLYWKKASDENYTEESITSNPYTLNGLDDNTEYEFYVVANCGGSDGESEPSNTRTFTTTCEAFEVTEETQYTYGFETSDLFGCWTPIAGAAIQNGSDNAHESTYSLKFSGTTNNMVALPPFVNATNTLRLEFWTRPESITNSSCGSFDVGYMTDLADASSFVAVATYAYNDWSEKVFEKKTVDFGNAPANAFIAMRQYNNSTSWYWFVDDVTVKLAPTCLAPTGLAVVENSVTAYEASLTWTAEEGATFQWNIDGGGEFADWFDIQDNTINLGGLASDADYTFTLRKKCSDTDFSEEISVNFHTLEACPAPTGFAVAENGLAGRTATLTWTGTSNSYTVSYRTKAYMDGIEEAFGASIPSGWENKTGLLSDVMGGTALSTGSQWSFGTSNNVFDQHARINIYGTSHYGWLITPEIELPAGAALSFNLALTAYSGTVAAPATTGTDDRFIVLISTDNEATWTILREWNNSGSTYVYNNIANTATGENVSIDLSTYAGQSVRIAFYGESTESNADNNLHIDNVAVGSPVAAGEWQTVTTEETTVTLTGLTPETLYEAKVQGDCGEEGLSDETALITFETLESCPAPTNLAVNYTGGVTAQVTWLGTAQTYNIDVNGTVTNDVTTPYTLEGLELATTYAVKVQTNCEEDETSEWTEAVSFTTDLCMPENQCEISYSFYDQYVDSWNGAYMNIVDAATEEVLYELTMPYEEGPYEGSFNVCDGRDIQFVWVSGNYPSECGYEFTHNGETILEKGTGETAPSAGVVLTYTVDCGFASYTLEIIGVGEDNWNSESDGGYYLIASPVESVTPTADNGFITADYDLYYFNEAATENEWVNFKGENGNFNLVSGKGYLYASKTDTQLQFTGVPYSGNGEVTLHKTDGANFEGWNLVGNPFNETAYLPANRAFYTMQNDGTVIAEVNPQQRSIEAMEAVFVVAENDGDTLTFSTTAPAKSAMVALNLNNRNSLIDRAIIRFDEGSTLPKLQLRRNSTKLYIPQDGNDYAVVRGESMGAMPVNFKAESNGRYTITLSSEEVSFSYLHLIDKVAKTDVDLLANPSYSFDAQTTDLANRFELVFATWSSTSSDTFAFYSNGNWVINNEGDATLQVIDVNGRILNSESINGCANVNLNAAAGVYMIRLVNGDNVKVQKVVVR
ncbi:MAG: choice-of-anchor J domain-containing protein [Bacteroidales bacterium]|nr:choice-of-anchor J domain-containing protein [Bacteroidales bacterium]